MPKCSNGKTDCRSFKISGSGIGFVGGRYVAENRLIAAQRAGSRLFKIAAADPKFANKKTIKFILFESTRGSSHQNVAYEATKIELENPKVIVKNNETITYRFTYNVIRLQKPENFDDINEQDMMKVYENPTFSEKTTPSKSK